MGKVRKSVSFLFVLVFMGALAWVGWSLVTWEHGCYANQAIWREVEEAQRRLTALRESLIDVGYEIEQYQNADLVIERALREKLLMSRPDEWVVYLT